MPELEAVVPPAEAVVYLVNLAVAVTLVCGMGLLAARACRHGSAPLRHGILVGTLALILLSPAAVWLAQENGVALAWVTVSSQPDSHAAAVARDSAPGVSGPGPLPSPEIATADAVTPRSVPANPPTAMPSNLASSDRPDAHASEAMPISGAAYENPPSAAAGSVFLSGENLRSLAWWQVMGTAAVIGWAVGTAIGLVRLGCGCLALARFWRRLTPLPDARQGLLVHQAADALGLREPPKVFVCRCVSVPLSIGLLRPAIVLPDSIEEEMDAGQLQAVLLHEMAHVARRDHWVGVGQRIATVLFWWNPLVRWVCGEISELREEICDNCVVLVQGEGQRLARILVDLAARAAVRPLLPSTLGVLEPKLAGLTRRVARLVTEERNMETRMNLRSRVFVLTCGVLVLIGIASIGGLRLAAAQPPLQTGLAAADPSAAPSPSSPAETKSSKPVADVKAKGPGPKSADAGAKAGSWVGALVGEAVGNQVAANRPSDQIEFRGQVLGPDDKPLPGARLYLLYYTSAEIPPPLVRATSGPDGNFRFTVAKSEFHARGEARPPWVGSCVVAVADGLGLGWQWGRFLDVSGQIAESLKSIPRAVFREKDGPPIIRLVRDDVPLTGRIVDPKGQPVVGATVQLLEIATSEQNDLTDWLNAIEKQKADYYRARMHVPNSIGGSLRSQLPRLVPVATTDGDGRFRLPGIGRERIARLQLEGPGIATERIDARTRPGPTLQVEQQATFSSRLKPMIYYGANFEHAVRPSRPIVGFVRDKDTHEPLGGVTIQAEKLAGDALHGSWNFIRAKTDGQGRYRLTGMPIGEDNKVLAVPPLDGLYLLSMKPADTRAERNAIQIDFELKRGIRIQGRVTDAATGQPVSAQMDYYVFHENPHSGSAPGFRGVSYGNFGNFYQTDAKGHYSIPGLPGRGIVTVKAHDHERYPRGAGGEKIKGADTRPGTPMFSTDPTYCMQSAFHALAEVNSAEGAKEIELNFVVNPHQRVEGTALDPEGRPLSGAMFSGRNEYFQWGPLFTEKFAVEGYQPDKPRTLLLVHHARRLAGGRVLQGPQKEPIAVRLEPWGAVTGRVVDAQGKPQADMVLTDGMNKLPPQSTIERLPGPNFVRTDREGRFRIEGLAPGVQYKIEALQETTFPAPIGRQRSHVSLVPDVVVRSSETKDLGDLALKPVKLPGATGQKEKSPK